MRSNKLKRLPALALAVCMVASVAFSGNISGVFAAEDGETAITDTTVQTEEEPAAEGDVQQEQNNEDTQEVDAESALEPEITAEADTIIQNEESTEDKISTSSDEQHEYIFYVDKDYVLFEPTYAQGYVKNDDGTFEKKTITHSQENIYIITQEDPDTKGNNYIQFHGNETIPYHVVLRNVNIGWSSVPTLSGTQQQQVNNTEGMILIPAESNYTKMVTLYLDSENIVNGIRYYTGVRNSGNEESYLTIDSYSQSGSESGTLYIPEKIAQEKIKDFIEQNKGYNHWNAGIGGTDSWEYVNNLTIAGGTLQVLTTAGDNCAAIGGGGNGTANISITGGNITAVCSGTGAAIGGGIGFYSNGGDANINISGGKVYAYNYGTLTVDEETVGGVAIGGGSSFKAAGSKANVYISGGTVQAFASYGNGIGSGNSALKSTYDAQIEISGGTITTNALGGGSSESAAGGNATILVNGGNVKCEETETYIGAFGIGGGTSKSGNGGTASITVNHGTLDCGNGTIGGGTSISNGNGGNASITVTNGTLYAGNIGGGDAKDTSSNYNGGDASINISGGTLKCASIGGGNSVSGTPGAVTSDTQTAGVVVTGGTLIANTIGGGTNDNGDIGFATADISGTGSKIQGRFILSNTDNAKQCFFRMSGGTIDNTALDTANQNGGAIYLTDPNGEVTISGGTIKNSKAALGGAVYMTAGRFTLSGSGIIQDCTAQRGGALYLDNGTVTVSGGKIISCKAENGTAQGGAIYLNNGAVTVSGGSIGEDNSPNTATQGAGVYMANGALQISGGSIGYNQADLGAGAYLAAGNLTVTGGAIANNTAVQSGGGAYLAGGSLQVSGGSFNSNQAPNGGGAYLQGGGLTLSGTGTFSTNTATANGGGAYLAGGSLQVNGGSFGGNTAQNGAGAYVSSGGITQSGGSFSGNTASQNGGGAYLAGGSLRLEDGSITNNTATQSGGGAYVADGKVLMFGGSITGNTASNGDGGGVYVSSSSTPASVVVRSGKITGNKAEAGNGGGIAVVTNGNAQADQLTLGVLEDHNIQDYTNRTFAAFDYKDAADNLTHTHASCPVLENNTATGDGGGIYMGSSKAVLHIYCLLESGNESQKDRNGSSVMAAGGTVVIGDQLCNEATEGETKHETAYGNVKISSAMLVERGTVDIWGTMENPLFVGNILVDIQSNADHFEDHREQSSDAAVEYKVHYFENFTAGGTQTATGLYTAIQYSADADVPALGTLFTHPGWRIIRWDTQADGKGTQYTIGSNIGSKVDHSAWGDDNTAPLVLYAIWQRTTYTVTYDPNANPFSGAMASQSFEYGVEQPLTANAYKAAGKRFTGWNTERDGSGTAYDDGYSESKMTDDNGATIPLYAQWVDCTHNGGDHPGTLTYTADAENATITETCDCGGHTATVTLHAVSVYYDGKQHPATLTYSSTALLAGNPTISYQYKAFDAGDNADYGDLVNSETVPTSKGSYVASITVGNKSVSVTYEIKDATQGITLDAKIAAGQFFADFNGAASAIIPQDDTFTMQFDVMQLNADVYTTAPTLTFTPALPQSTTVIMQTGDGYWYLKVDSAGKDTVNLSDFTQMGGTAKFSYNTTNLATEQSYRFIGDFSQAEMSTGSQSITLTYAPAEGQGTDSLQCSVTLTTTEKGRFSLEQSGGTLTVTAPQSTTTNRWNGKQLVLVLSVADSIPADAKLTAAVGDKTSQYYLNSQKQFVVPLDWAETQNVTLTLSSDLASAAGQTYTLAANLYTSTSGQKLLDTNASLDDVSLTVPANAAPALKLSGSKHVFALTDSTLDLTVDARNTDSCTISATIEQKSGNTYSGNFLTVDSVNTGDNHFSLSAITTAGSYRLVVTVSKNNQTLLQVPYYFIVQ